MKRVLLVLASIVGLTVLPMNAEAQPTPGHPDTYPSPASRPAPEQDRWWDNPPTRPPPGSQSGVPIAAIGGGLAGLGGLALFAASITWLVAAGESLAVDEESCPNKLCYENSRGGEALRRARDAEQAAGVLVGIGVPVLTTGLAMVLFGAGLGGQAGKMEVSTAVGADGGGLTLKGHF